MTFTEDIATGVAAVVAGIAVLVAGVRKLQLIGRAETRTDAAGQSRQNGFEQIVTQLREEVARQALVINDLGERLGKETRLRYTAEAAEAAAIREASARATATSSAATVATAAATAASVTAAAASIAAAKVASTLAAKEADDSALSLRATIAGLEAEIRELKLMRGAEMP